MLQHFNHNNHNLNLSTVLTLYSSLKTAGSPTLSQRKIKTKYKVIFIKKKT